MIGGAPGRGGIALGVAAAIAVGALFALAPAGLSPVETAVYRADVAVDAAAADEALAALRSEVDGALRAARDGAAATASGKTLPGKHLMEAAQRLDGARPAADNSARRLAGLRGQLAIAGHTDAPPLLVSGDDLASIAQQLRDAAVPADAFASMRLGTLAALEGLRDALVALDAHDVDRAATALATARENVDAVRAWPGRLATLPLWIAAADRLLEALDDVVDARRAADSDRERRALAAYEAATNDASQADRALAIALAEGAASVTQAPLARLADALSKIDAARDGVAAAVQPS